MVGKDLSYVEITLKVMTKVAECVNDGQEFFIVDLVIPLCGL